MESTQYSSPSSVHHYKENNCAMRDVTLVTLCLCHFPALLLATFLAGFLPQRVLRPSPAKSESSPDMEVEAVSSRAVLQFMLLCLKMNVEAFCVTQHFLRQCVLLWSTYALFLHIQAENFPISFQQKTDCATAVFFPLRMAAWHLY